MNMVLNFDTTKGSFNPYKYSDECELRGKTIRIRYTEKAKQALAASTSPLIIEMQIYFSCMVQKRVLFHRDYAHEKVVVNDKLAIALRIVQSDVCDPVVYAASHPEKRELKNKKANKMTIKEVIFDYQKAGWIGNFKIG